MTEISATDLAAVTGGASFLQRRCLLNRSCVRYHTAQTDTSAAIEGGLPVVRMKQHDVRGAIVGGARVR